VWALGAFEVNPERESVHVKTSLKRTEGVATVRRVVGEIILKNTALFRKVDICYRPMDMSTPDERRTVIAVDDER
jgi:hypothetical protein